MQYKCAYCGKQLTEECEVFLIGGKLKPEVDVREEEGQMISFSMSYSGKNISAVVPASNSEAKTDGFDVGFIVCSENCAKYLRNDLQTEIINWAQRKSETRRRLESSLKPREGEAISNLSEVWPSLSEETKDMLTEDLLDSEAESGKEYYRKRMIGDCPRCGSSKTRDCKDLPGIDDSTVGSCIDCGHLWCLECGLPLPQNNICEHWEVCDACDDCGEQECSILTWECEKIQKWLRERNTDLD